LVLHLLKQPKEVSESLLSSLKDFREKISFCKICHNLSDQEICEICFNPNRDKSQICVVEDIRDVMAIENTNQYKGIYHVLNGIISPIDGIGPNDLTIESLVSKVKNSKVQEVIFALSSTMESDTTVFYIHKQLINYKIKISTIARGIPVGDELEYTDEITLARSIAKRVPYEGLSSDL
jgi:recombination protein RecR